MKKFLPCFADLIDRLSIHLLKEIRIPEIKKQIIKEKFDILNDLGEDIKNKHIKLTPEIIHAIIIIAELNCTIWDNESQARKGKDQDLQKLYLTHSLNGLRMDAKNRLQCYIGESKLDEKKDCLAKEAIVSDNFIDYKYCWEYKKSKKE